MVRVGFLGSGGIANVHMRNLRDNEQAEIVAICDVLEEKAKQTAEEFGAVPYTDIDKMLDQEKLDALFICTPPFARGDIEVKVANKGIHLFLEKPLGLDMEVVKKNYEEIKKTGVMVGTGYALRYLKNAERAKEFLKDKEFSLVRGFRFSNRHPRAPWWIDIDKSGGQLVENTTHNLDMMMDIGGGVRKVFSSSVLKVMKDLPGINTPEAQTVDFEFENGAIGQMSAAFIAQPDSRQHLEFIGRDFRLEFRNFDLTIVEKGHEETFKNDMNVITFQDQVYIEAVATGNADLIKNPYEGAMKTLEFTLAANESARTGQPIYLG